MAARLCVVRHGETAWNAEGRVQGQLDVPLSATGLTQARCVAAALPERRFSALYSSDLQRVLQTAQPAAEKLGLEVCIDARLRERHYGAFQGLTYTQAKESRPDDYARFKAKEPEFAFGSGESLRAFFERAIQCIEAIARRHDGEEVLVFTHGGVLEMAYRRATGCGLSTPRRCELPNAALNWIEAGEPGWRVLGWADCAHLAAALDDLP
ncbi:MAG TPA: histidine phosphatase family protein [Burkholderiales bacterium]|jgi:probable phosphoglycerate mutase